MSRIWILGGTDGEMDAIKALLSLFGEQWVQPRHGWGAHVYTPSDVGVEILPPSTGRLMAGGHAYDPGPNLPARLPAGLELVVFVECLPGEGWPKGSTRVIDHHGERSGEAPAIQQVVRLLGQQLSPELLRWVELVGANDAGYFPALLALGATPAEIARIRAFDRRAQGVTPAEEDEAARACAAAEIYPEGLIVVRCAHARCAPITDRLHAAAGGPGYRLLLVLSPGEQNAFGDGLICAGLRDHAPGSWAGGSGLGHSGQEAFWGWQSEHGDRVLEVVKVMLGVGR